MLPLHVRRRLGELKFDLRLILFSFQRGVASGGTCTCSLGLGCSGRLKSNNMNALRCPRAIFATLH